LKRYVEKTTKESYGIEDTKGLANEIAKKEETN
jgi:hypothetical protein